MFTGSIDFPEFIEQLELDIPIEFFQLFFTPTRYLNLCQNSKM